MAPKETITIDLEVPGLGTVTGLCHDNDHCQYLGIPYATVPGRFRRSKPSATPWPDNKLDGTKLRFVMLVEQDSNYSTDKGAVHTPHNLRETFIQFLHRQGLG